MGVISAAIIQHNNGYVATNSLSNQWVSSVIGVLAADCAAFWLVLPAVLAVLAVPAAAAIDGAGRITA